MFTNLKLRGRIFLGFSIPVILILGFSGLVYFVLNPINAIFKDLNREQQAVVETDNMVIITGMMAQQVRGYLLIKNEDPLREYEKQKQRYQRAVEAASKAIIDSQEREIFKELVQLGERFDALAKETFRLKNLNKDNEAINYYLRESKTILDKYDSLSNQINDIEAVLLNTYIKEANDSIQFLILAAVVTVLLSMGFASIAASLLWGTIAKTNKTINQTVNAMVSSSTEIGATVEQQERMASQQAVSVNQTTITMNELAASSKSSAEQAESSATKASQVLTLADSSVDGARQVLALADESATGARQVLTLAEGGTKTVGRTLEEMSLLKEKVEAIAEQIVRLNDQNNQIGGIINIVTDLASQTNMLALNAAVEAVRAGEHGRGFAVVASEIRKLADQSKKSAEKINNLVVAIQSAINSTVIVTQEGRKTAQEGIQLSQETAQSFASVRQAIENIVLTSSKGVAEAIKDIVLSNQQAAIAAINDVVISSQQISLTSQQQAIAIQQVVDAMNSLNHSAVQTASGITQTKIGIQKLNEAAQNLQTLV
ncbi:methyl-accepting chemotaxis protein [Kamptonema animale CS-326]|jgi:methyl-accepting chemotaxis protein|uniref:methyl-accepting chemotaxis protein n=1 Tax=Kamptonema animale TaxID=92934 RepID=UPI00232B5F15|nr:methyl-accepting chemotaxis protein [Kamptonema animale]MDB9509799.1 methyl-accepting chemotaxis protein [Kamptonema animale CS-326]